MGVAERGWMADACGAVFQRGASVQTLWELCPLCLRWSSLTPLSDAIGRSGRWWRHTLSSVAIIAKQLARELAELRSLLGVFSAGWESKLTPELRHAARYTEIDSCTRLVSGPGHPVQAALWVMVAKRLTERPDLLSARAAKRGELSGRGSRSEIVVVISGACFAVPLTLSAAMRMTQNATKTLESALAAGHDQWAGWLPQLRDEKGTLALSPTLVALHAAVNMLIDCMNDFSLHRDVVGHRVDHRAGAADSWYTLVGVVGWLGRLMPMVRETLPQASRLPDQDLPLGKRARTSLRQTLDAMEGLLANLGVSSRPGVPGLVAGRVWEARALPVASWEGQATAIKELCAVFAEYAGQATAAGEAAKPREYISTEPTCPNDGDWRRSTWILEAVRAFNKGSALDDQELRRLATSGSFGRPGAWQPSRVLLYDVGVLASKLPRRADCDAIARATREDFMPARKPRGKRKRSPKK
jgi:hypothetical protein